MKLTPESIPRVALDFMNRDHAEFVLLRERLLDLLSARAPSSSRRVGLMRWPNIRAGTLPRKSR